MVTTRRSEYTRTMPSVSLPDISEDEAQAEVEEDQQAQVGNGPLPRMQVGCLFSVAMTKTARTWRPSCARCVQYTPVYPILANPVFPFPRPVTGEVKPHPLEMHPFGWVRVISTLINPAISNPLPKQKSYLQTMQGKR
jgi:hypothetical protein